MCGSDSIVLIAFSTEATGPKTTDPTFSSPSCRFMAIRYSSSTTRMRRSRSAELAILHLLSLRAGEWKRDRAMDTVRFDRKSCPGSELIGQRVLDEPPPASVPPASSRDSRRVDASFSPVDENPWRAILGFHSPTNIQTAVSLSQGAIFQGIGRQLVQGHRQGLDGDRSKRDALGSVDRKNSAVFGRLNGQFRRETLIKADAPGRRRTTAPPARAPARRAGRRNSP